MKQENTSILSDKHTYQFAKRIYIIRYNDGEYHFTNKRKAEKFQRSMPEYLKAKLIIT